MFKGCQLDQSVFLLCVRWYLAYTLSLRDLEEMMAERSIAVDHTTIHRWTVRYAPQLLKRFNRCQRSVTGKWHIDETYIKVRGQWLYWFSEQRNLPSPKRLFRKALATYSRPSFPVAPQIACRPAPGAG